MEFDFVAHRAVLDFLATVAERGTTHEEKPERPEDLAAWAVQSGLTSDLPTVTARQLASAIALRETMYRLLSAVLDGASPAPEDRELVNAAARVPRPVPQLSRSGDVTRTGSVQALLAALTCD